MLTLEQQAELYGGLPKEETVRAFGSGWWISTPTIRVEGERDLTVFVQGGIHSEYAQLSHKVRRFVLGSYSVVCLSQTGAATVDKSPEFYETGDYSRTVTRDVAILDKLGVEKVIAYGSSIGAAASIALAAEHPDRVAAVIAVNPASLIDQKPWRLTLNFFLSNLQSVKKDFDPSPTKGVGVREAWRELRDGVADLAASDIGISYLERVKCPVLIFTGNDDHVFPGRRLSGLDILSNVKLLTMVDFIHSDPNSRGQMDRVFSLANRELQQLGTI